MTMQRVCLDPRHPKVQKIIRSTFPASSRAKVDLDVSETIVYHGAYWDEGSRNEYIVLNLTTYQTDIIPDRPWNTPSPRHDAEQPIFPGTVVVCRSHFRGGESLHLTGRAEDVTDLMPPPGPEVTEDEKIVLIATRSLKPSYAGVSNYRFHQARERRGITQVRWEDAKASCIQKGLLNKAGAITPAGRNATNGESL